MQVMSPQGQVLLTQVLTETRNTADLSGLTPGMYFIRLDAGDWHAVRKIVKR